MPAQQMSAGSPGGDDTGDDLGDDLFNNNDNGNNENNDDNIDEATNVLQAFGHAIENLAHASQHNEEYGTSSRKTRVHKPDTFDVTQKIIPFEWTTGKIADAENQLNHLQMKDGQHINKYTVEFNRLSSQVHGHRDGELCHYFYSGLPDCIKDEICWEINMCYWEHKEEIQWANRHQTSAQNSSNKSSSSTPNSSHNKSAPNSAPSSKSSNNNDKKSTNTLSSNPKLANKLSKDGKLMVAEHKRHYDLKLCMFCGGDGHFTDKCEEKVAKNKAKACAAKATESPQEQSSSTLGSAPEAKK
ncbi:hypothetical protein ID866_9070 [Astraeus odoratus]|nr:hypothetical protein ID866_9070 [Astraeus odoratus]